MDKITLRTLLWPRRDERPMMTAVLVPVSYTHLTLPTTSRVEFGGGGG